MTIQYPEWARRGEEHMNIGTSNLSIYMQSTPVNASQHRQVDIPSKQPQYRLQHTYGAYHTLAIGLAIEKRVRAQESQSKLL
ncbi:hypothetical protein BofuT4_P098870.1 [Botrytis cinerea T4]|uniref:Uncharacterized protein n=1 Tax=Botryotinia fuckeliana (strain T4) TaxID=999810 RepID=G2YC90_BOTF4|nr:hypothetical protein BofuT4_P098870.1 [Botrytis cinerea T4]